MAGVELKSMRYGAPRGGVELVFRRRQPQRDIIGVGGLAPLAHRFEQRGPHQQGHERHRIDFEGGIDRRHGAGQIALGASCGSQIHPARQEFRVQFQRAQQQLASGAQLTAGHCLHRLAVQLHHLGWHGRTHGDKKNGGPEGPPRVSITAR